MKSTRLVIEGVSPDEITIDFLVAVAEISEDHDLAVDGISILRNR